MALPTFRAATPTDMRRSMGRFTTGVAVVSTGTTPADWCGMTISSLTSISLEPPILMISLTEGSRTTDMVSQSGKFTVSILSSRQEAVARHFATRGGSRYETVEYDVAQYGLPMIKNCLVQAECKVHSSSAVGDHTVFFGDVDNLRFRDGAGLVFSSGHFGDFQDFGHDEVPWLF